MSMATRKFGRASWQAAQVAYLSQRKAKAAQREAARKSPTTRDMRNAHRRAFEREQAALAAQPIVTHTRGQFAADLQEAFTSVVETRTPEPTPPPVKAPRKRKAKVAAAPAAEPPRVTPEELKGSVDAYVGFRMALEELRIEQESTPEPIDPAKLYSESRSKFWAWVGREFDASEVKSKVGGRGEIIRYIDARNVQERLDECFGPEGWTSKVEALPEHVKCRLYVRTPDGTRVMKEDVGSYPYAAWCEAGDDQTHRAGESTKAGASDALKRAAVHLGIGRYLYKSDPTPLADVPTPRPSRYPAPPTAAELAEEVGRFAVELQEADRVRPGIQSAVMRESWSKGFPTLMGTWTPSQVATARGMLITLKSHWRPESINGMPLKAEVSK